MNRVKERVPQVYVESINVVAIPSGQFLSAAELAESTQQSLAPPADSATTDAGLESPWAVTDDAA